MSEVKIHTVLSTLPSGHVVALYTASKGVHEGQRRIGLVSPSGKPVRSAPATVAASPAPTVKPARVNKPARKPVAKAASKPAKSADFVELLDENGDGGLPGIALVECVPSAPTPPRNSPPRKGEKFAAFASRIGMNFADAGPAWRAHKDALADTKAAAESAVFVAEMTAKSAPVAPALPTERITSARKARKAARDAEVTTLSDSVAANSAGIAQILALLSK